jgi:hypothetical protein
VKLTTSVLLGISVVATHTGSCTYPRAHAVDVPAVRGSLVDAGVVREADTVDGALVVELADGRSLRFDDRQYLAGGLAGTGDLLLVGPPDGGTLLAVVPHDDDLDCFAVYSPAQVRGDQVLLWFGMLVPRAETATDQEVLEPAEGSPSAKPLVEDATFYTHDAACLDGSGVVTGIRRGIYEGGEPNDDGG